MNCFRPEKDFLWSEVLGFWSETEMFWLEVVCFWSETEMFWSEVLGFWSETEKFWLDVICFWLDSGVFWSSVSIFRLTWGVLLIGCAHGAVACAVNWPVVRVLAGVRGVVNHCYAYWLVRLSAVLGGVSSVTGVLWS